MSRFNIGEFIHIGDGEVVEILDVKTHAYVHPMTNIQEKDEIYYQVQAFVGNHWISTELVMQHNKDIIRNQKIEEILG